MMSGSRMDWKVATIAKASAAVSLLPRNRKLRIAMAALSTGDVRPSATDVTWVSRPLPRNA